MDMEFLKNLKKQLNDEKTDEGFNEKLKDFVKEQNKINEDAEKAGEKIKNKYDSINDLEGALQKAREEHDYNKPSDKEMERVNDFAQVQLAKIDVDDAKAKYDLAIEVYEEIKKEYEEKHGKIEEDK